MIQKTIMSLAVLQLLVLAGPAIGQTDAIKPSKTVVEAELTYFHIDYNEKVPAPLKSQEIGWLPGVRFTVSQKPGTNPNTMRFLLQIASGELIYDGSLQDGTPYSAKGPHTFIDVEADTIHRFTQIGSPYSASTYLGFGIRRWKRGEDVEPSYVENYTLLYMPIGVKGEFAVGSRVSIGLDASLKPMLGGRIGVPKFDLSGTLGATIGARIEAPIKVRITPQIGLHLRPWYEYSAIGKGDLLFPDFSYAGAYEPDSTTKQYGVDAGLQYAF